jgi:hypothetical protein
MLPAVALELSVIVNVALSAAPVLGVNVTLIVQFAPDATLVPQVLVCAKSVAFVPEMAIPVTASEAVPVLLSVTAIGELVVDSA